MNSSTSPRWETAAAIDRLTRLIHLPDVGQDWELEAADPARLTEFCGLYESGALDAETQFALMRLIIASLDEALEGESVTENTAHCVERLLRRDFILHLHTVHYWSLLDEVDPENVSPVTPMMRLVWADHFNSKAQTQLE